MSQEMTDGDLEWLSKDDCRDMKQLLNYADGRISIFDTGLFNHRENDEHKKSFILRGGLGVPTVAARAKRRLFTSS